MKTINLITLLFPLILLLGCGGKIGSPSIIGSLVSDNAKFIAVTDKTFQVNISNDFSLMAINISNEPLLYCLDPGAPAGVNLDGTTGEVSWTPINTQYGINTLTFYLSITNDCLIKEDQLNLQVTVVNHGPSISSISNQTVTEGDTIAVNANDSNTGNDTDDDGDAITYQCYYDESVDGSIVKDSNFECSDIGTFNAATGVFNWITVDGDNGTYEVKIFATEGVSAYDSSIIFTITVEDAGGLPAGGGGGPVSPVG